MSRHMAQSWVLAEGRATHVRIAGKILFTAVGVFDLKDRQRTVVQFWYEVDPDGPKPPRRTFQVFPTGRDLPDGAVWCGSVKADDGHAWHLYELAGEGDD